MSRFKAAVFDWAGTMVDFGSFAPMGVFVEVFQQFKIKVSVDEARGPMGMPKWDHIRTMLEQPRIAEQWQQVYGHSPDKSAVDQLFEVFVPMNEKVVAKYADLVPGAKSMIDELRHRGLKIGSTTGYTRSIMQNVLPLAAAQGYSPDNLVCADDLPEGRPGPLGMYRCFIDLCVYPPATVIKVDDTEPGIAEGVAAGCVTVGVTLSGNYAGKTPEEISALSEHELGEIRNTAGTRLRQAGADHIIDTVADLPALIDQLESGD